MSENTGDEIVRLFTEKIDEMRNEFREYQSLFEEERKRRQILMNRFLVAFGIAILTFVFSAGIIVQKVNSLEQNYYKVAEKVETLYMVAIQNGDIKFDTRGAKTN